MGWSRARCHGALLAVTLTGCHIVFPHSPSESTRTDLERALDSGSARDLVAKDGSSAREAGVLLDLAGCLEPPEITLAPKCNAQSLDAALVDGDRDGVLDLLDPDLGYCNPLLTSEELSTAAHAGVSANSGVAFLCGEARMAPGSTLDATSAFLGKLPSGKIVLEVRFTLKPQSAPWGVTIAASQQDGTPITCSLRQLADGQVMLSTDGCGKGPNSNARPVPPAQDHRLLYYNDGWLVGCRVLRDGSLVDGPGVNCTPTAPAAISVTVSGIEITIDHLRAFEKN